MHPTRWTTCFRGRLIRGAMALVAAAFPLTAMTAASGQTSPAAPATKPAAAPPAYTPVRWNEDYSYLKDPARRTDFFDPIKYIPLNEAGDWYLSLGGSARYRYENFYDGNNFGAGVQDDNGFHLTRLMAHADLHLGPNLRGFVQGLSGMEDGRDPEPRPGDADEIEVHQAFADLKFSLGGKDSLTIRGGRQNLLYGYQRLIGPLDWTNARRTFDGGKASLALGPHALDVFVVQPLIMERESPNWHDGDQTFSGIYDTIALPDLIAGANSKLELYGLILNQSSRPAIATAVPPVGGIALDTDTYTVGARFTTNPKPFDLDLEADYQFGKAGSGDISAWAVAFEGGYSFVDAPLMPRLFLGFDAASGDDDLADPDKQTFNQLFPTGHLHFGYIDAIGRQNIIDIHPGIDLALLSDKAFAKKVALRAEYHMFWRHSDADAVYNAGGGVLRGDLGSDETYVGSEFDLLLNWQIDRHWAAYLGYSHFFAGDFIQDTGPSEDTDFLYVAMTLTF